MLRFDYDFNFVSRYAHSINDRKKSLCLASNDFITELDVSRPSSSILFSAFSDPFIRNCFSSIDEAYFL